MNKYAGINAENNLISWLYEGESAPPPSDGVEILQITDEGYALAVSTAKTVNTLGFPQPTYTITREDLLKTLAPDYPGFLMAYVDSEIDDHLAELADTPVAQRRLGLLTTLIYGLVLGIVRPDSISSQFAKFLSAVDLKKVNLEYMKELEKLLVTYRIPLSVADNFGALEEK